ncbi:MAG: elongation factor G [Eubacteriales bacterium]|nr:elongation factor G [Eubacteriales bacterium]
MQAYTADKIRNIAILGHSGSGKSSLIEAMLFNSGAIDRIAKAGEGQLTMDFDQEEQRRHITINTSAAACEWKSHKFNFIDTPGDFDFVGEVMSALHVVGSTLVMVSAKAGLEVGVEKAVRLSKNEQLPMAFFVNKIDDENIDYNQVISELKDRFGRGVTPFVVPIHEDRRYIGFYDVLGKHAYHFDGKGGLVDAEASAEVLEEAERCREALVEQAAESDDELMMKFFEGEPLTDEELFAGLRQRIFEGLLIPVWCGSATENFSIRYLMDQMAAFMPSSSEKKPVLAHDAKGEWVELPCSTEGPRVAYIFKTIADPFVGKISYFRVFSGVFSSDQTAYNPSTEKEERLNNMFFMVGKKQIPVTRVEAGDIAAFTKLSNTFTGDTLSERTEVHKLDPVELPHPYLTLAIFPEKQGEDDKIAQGLSKLREEDPTFEFAANPETKQMTISGVGEMQVDVIVSKLKNRYKVSAYTEPAKVPYREMIRKKVKAQGRHKKQTGGHGQFADVWIEFEPNLESEALVFDEKVFGGAVPKAYFPAVEKGLQEAVHEGVLAGYPVVNLKATLVDGSYHDVDSSEMAFKIAARLAYKNGLEQASPVLMEPYSSLKVYCPEEDMGDIMGDVNKRRGRILGIEPREEYSIVSAEVPTSELGRYATDLRSMTQGRGFFSMEFARYEQMPDAQAQRVIDEAKKAQEQ